MPRSSFGGGRIVVPAHYHYVSPWYFYSPYVYGAFGFGFWGYDPFWWGYPGFGFGFSWGYPYYGGWGYPYYGGWGYPYPGGGAGYGYDYGITANGAGGQGASGQEGQEGQQAQQGGGQYYEPRGTGSLKLKVKPKEAEVYVDGYYMGQVDDFDGSWQHLDLESGSHHIQIRAAGYEPLSFDTMISPNHTTTYQADLRRLQEPNK